MGLKKRSSSATSPTASRSESLTRELSLHRKTVRRYVAEHKVLLAERAMTGDIPDGGVIEPTKY